MCHIFDWNLDSANRLELYTKLETSTASTEVLSCETGSFITAMRTRTDYGEGPFGNLGDESGLTAVGIKCMNPKTRAETEFEIEKQST